MRRCARTRHNAARRLSISLSLLRRGDLNTAEAHKPGWRSLPDLFADQAGRSPDAIAITFEGETLTYAQLADRSNRLARLLIDRGVGPGSIVPILLDRSALTIVAILGVLTAGGCYMPMDPEAPLARTQVLLEDSGASLMLTSVALAGAAAALGPIDVVRIDDPDILGLIASRSPDRVHDPDRREALCPQHLSFIIYTSGTTGTPKGSGNTEAGIVNCLQWLLHEMELNADDRVLHQTTLIFDMAVLEIFLPLISGGVLVIARPGGHRDTAYIARLIQAEAVTLAFFVPTTLLDFVREEGTAGCESLRNIVAAGEALTGYVQARCHATLPAATLWNGYGPSEAAVLVTLWRCRREDAGTAPPIGRPCWQTDAHILGDDLKPVAVGTRGELFVAGTPLARGYLRRPELTAEKFIPSPFGPPGAVMYRTGDIARLREDGSLEFHGRRDSQIKLNGVRIEPGEVEAAIAELAGIARVAVIARNLSGETRLIAYMIAAQGSPPPDSASLRTALTDRLPRHMVPSFFVFVDAFPLTASGKLAARDLPDPETVGAQKGYAALTTALAAKLALLFGELTGAESVSADQDFFELGGTSLTAMRLAARLRSEASLALPMSLLIEYPTPAGLAAALQRPKDSTDQDAAPAPRPIMYVFAGAGGQSIGLARLCAACSDILDMRVIDYPDWTTICRQKLTFEEIVDDIARIVSELEPAEEILLLGYSLGGGIAYSVALTMARTGRPIAFVGLMDSEPPAHSRAPAHRPAVRLRRLAKKLRRSRESRSIGRALSYHLLARTPPLLLRFAPAIAGVLPAESGVALGLNQDLMAVLTRRWLRQPTRMSEHLNAAIVLFRVREADEDDMLTEAWAQRTNRLETVFVEGDHLSMLSGVNFTSFVDTFRARVLTALSWPGLGHDDFTGMARQFR
jgi:amino acid adenylation domain-containing protein